MFNNEKIKNLEQQVETLINSNNIHLKNIRDLEHKIGLYSEVIDALLLKLNLTAVKELMRKDSWQKYYSYNLLTENELKAKGIKDILAKKGTIINEK